MSALPHHPVLRPGVQSALRGDGTLQIGLPPAPCVIAPDTAAVRQILRSLEHGVAAPSLREVPAEVARLYRDLLDAGLLTESAALFTAQQHALSAYEGTEQARLNAETLAADFATPHADVEALRSKRGRCVVAVLSHRMPVWTTQAEHLLTALGFTIDQRRRPDVVLMLSAGELPRATVDAWQRDDLVHLLLTCGSGRVQLGPFVVPGQTACLRCFDAHRSDRDPRWPLLIEQHTRRPHHSDTPAPIPADLATAALAMAVREIAQYAETASPSTLNQRLLLGPDLMLPAEQCPPHPACGCSWRALATG